MTGHRYPVGMAVAQVTSASFSELIGEFRDTFDSGHTRSLEWRRSQLDGMLALLAENESELIGAIQTDLGRPAMEAFAADIAHATGEVAFMRRHLSKWMRPVRARLPLSVLPGKGRILSEPLGVALVIAPWNYPIQLLLEPMAAALAAGNCVVGKPSELSPATSAALARLVPKYLDPAAVTLVEGGVEETTALLDQYFDHIFFTGSGTVGRIVMKAAAEHLTPVTLELGGKSPVIVAADANIASTARRIVLGKQLNAGQSCVAPDYVLVERSARNELLTALSDTSAEFLDTEAHESPNFGRIINDRHHARLVGLLEGHGGEVVTGGEHDASDRFIAPTIIADPEPDSAVMRDEIFGPILPVVTVDRIDDAIRFVNNRPKPLALYVFTESKSTAQRVLDHTSSGGACVNHTVIHLIPPNLPFGGVGPSGMGSYHGRTGFETFSHRKSVLYRPSWPDPKIVYPPYTELKEKVIRKLI